jgi:ABC transporter DrrB family efflux protein
MREFVREPAVVFWALLFPLCMMVVLGLAFRPQEPPPVPVLISVEPGNAFAEGMKSALEACHDLKVVAKTPDEAALALTRGEAALLVVPVKASVPEYRYDPTHPEARTTRLLVNAALRDYLAPGGKAPELLAPLEEKSPAPGGRYIDWFVPGMVGMSIMNGSLWGLGFALVEMRAKRLLKRFAVTPMKRSHFLGAQALQRFLVVALQAIGMLVFARLAFGVQVRGSVLVFAAVAVVGTLTFAGIALLVATRARNTEVAAGIMNIPMLPQMFLSGVFFSYAKFPDWLQPAIKALPLTALLDAFRRVANEGKGLESVLPQLGVLAVWGAITGVLALKLFRWS